MLLRVAAVLLSLLAARSSVAAARLTKLSLPPLRSAPSLRPSFGTPPLGALAAPVLAAPPVLASPAAPPAAPSAPQDAPSAPASPDDPTPSAEPEPSEVRVPRVVVIGGGIAGLSALHELARFGVSARLYEAQAEVGGRMLTQKHAGTGLDVDAGAEFVSSTHDSLLALMAELGVSPVRRVSTALPRVFIYRGRAVEEGLFQRLLFRKAGPQLDAITRDAETVRRAARARDLDVLRAYDGMTIGAYLDRIEAPPILRAFVKAVVDSESGRDHRTLSSVVLFECLSVDRERERVAVLPDEDETYKIAGGAGGIVTALARRHAAAVDREHRLVSVESRDGKSYRLTFDTPQGARVVEADHVVMTLPPPDLKDVAVSMPGWTPALRKAVEGVVFGSHMKLTLFFSSRPWKRVGHSASGLSDSGLAFWESSEGQPGERGSITFLGRAAPLFDAGVDALSRPAQLVSRLLRQLSRAIPGLREAYVGMRADVWQRSYPFADAPGDPYGYILTWLGRREFSKFSPAPLGNFHWAGDLYSAKSPAYMNGAVETGLAAARAVAAALGLAPAK